MEYKVASHVFPGNRRMEDGFAMGENMMRAYRFILAALACLTTVPASSAELPFAPQVSWAVAFGGAAGAVDPEVGLGLRATSLADDLQPEVARLQLGAGGMGLSFAGVPVAADSYARAQDGDADYRFADAPAAKPWYARSWVLWTVGGLAATAAVTGGLSSGDDSTCSGICDQDDDDDINTSVNGVGPDGAGCVGDMCAVCENGDIASDCNWEGNGLVARGVAAFATRDVTRERWLDAGTGRMGDLIAR
jgi:hypothetical protein